MNKKLKVVIGVIIVILSILSMGTKFWADAEALSFHGPSFMRVTPKGHLAIVIGRTIYVVDKKGLTKQIIDLESVGIQNHGDFDFFKNGDLLIYHGASEFSFIESIERFLRRKEERQDTPTGNVGLLRCNNEGKNCEKFSSELPAFHSSFRLNIDRKTDTVYIADTPRFALYKLSEEGGILATKKDGFKFPNQILLHEEKLYVANTNYNAVKIVHAETEKFGEEISSHKTKVSRDNIWPSQLLVTQDKWWVMIAGDGMSDGRLQIYNNDWETIYSPKLDIAADPMGIVFFADEILAADWSNFKIYRFDQSGKRMPDFKNKEIDILFNDANQKILFYKSISFYGLIAFIIVVIFGFIAAYKVDRKEAVQVLKAGFYGTPVVNKHESIEQPPGADIFWIVNKANRFGSTFFSGVLNCLCILIIFSGYIVCLFNEELLSWAMHAAMISIAIFITFLYIQWQKIIRVKIGVQGEHLFIDDGCGHVVSGKGKAIRFGQEILVIDDVVAAVKPMNKGLFSTDEYEKYVVPRMHKGQQISIWESLKLQWSQKHPNILYKIAIITPLVLMVVAVVYLKINTLSFT